MKEKASTIKSARSVNFGPHNPPAVFVTMESGEEKKLFEYYSLCPGWTLEELVGLTEKEACLLKFRRDKNQERRARR